MKAALEWVRNLMRKDDGWVYFRVKRPEDYDDVHEELVMADFLETPKQWEIEIVAKEQS